MGFYQKLCFPGAALFLTTGLTAHTAGTAAHTAGAATHAPGLPAHLTGIVFRAVVGGEGTAVVGVGAVAVQRGISVAVAGKINGAAVDGQSAAGVDAVTGGYNHKFSAVYHNETVGAPPETLLSGHSSSKAGAVRSAGGV